MSLLKTEDGLYTKNMRVLIKTDGEEYSVFNLYPKYCGKFTNLESAVDLAKSVLLEAELNTLMENDIYYLTDLLEYAEEKSYKIKYDYDIEDNFILINIDNNEKDSFLQHLKESVEIMAENILIKINYNEEEQSLKNDLE